MSINLKLNPINSENTIALLRKKLQAHIKQDCCESQLLLAVMLQAMKDALDLKGREQDSSHRFLHSKNLRVVCDMIDLDACWLLKVWEKFETIYWIHNEKQKEPNDAFTCEQDLVQTST